MNCVHVLYQKIKGMVRQNHAYDLEGKCKNESTFEVPMS
jgi:hypothetical protein